MMGSLREHKNTSPKILLEISAVNQSELFKKIKSLNGSYIDSKYFEKSATHLITDVVNCSEKFIGACIKGLWILSPKYIEDSYEAGYWLKEDDYEYSIEDKNQPSELIEAAKNWRWKVSTLKQPPFSGMCVALLLRNKSVTFERLLLYGGAKVFKLTVPLQSEKNLSEISLVFMDPFFKGHAKILGEYGLLCLHYKYVVDFIVKSEEVDLFDYVIKDSSSVTPWPLNQNFGLFSRQEEICSVQVDMCDQPNIQKMFDESNYSENFIDLTIDTETAPKNNCTQEKAEYSIKLEPPDHSGVLIPLLKHGRKRFLSDTQMNKNESKRKFVSSRSFDNDTKDNFTPINQSSKNLSTYISSSTPLEYQTKKDTNKTYVHHHSVSLSLQPSIYLTEKGPSTSSLPANSSKSSLSPLLKRSKSEALSMSPSTASAALSMSPSTASKSCKKMQTSLDSFGFSSLQLNGKDFDKKDGQLLDQLPHSFSPRKNNRQNLTESLPKPKATAHRKHSLAKRELSDIKASPSMSNNDNENNVSSQESNLSEIEDHVTSKESHLSSKNVLISSKECHPAKEEHVTSKKSHLSPNDEFSLENKVSQKKACVSLTVSKMLPEVITISDESDCEQETNTHITHSPGKDIKGLMEQPVSTDHGFKRTIKQEPNDFSLVRRQTGHTRRGLAKKCVFMSPMKGDSVSSQENIFLPKDISAKIEIKISILPTNVKSSILWSTNDKGLYTSAVECRTLPNKEYVSADNIDLQKEDHVPAESVGVSREEYVPAKDGVGLLKEEYFPATESVSLPEEKYVPARNVELPKEGNGDKLSVIYKEQPEIVILSDTNKTDNHSSNLKDYYLRDNSNSESSVNKTSVCDSSIEVNQVDLSSDHLPVTEHIGLNLPLETKKQMPLVSKIISRKLKSCIKHSLLKISKNSERKLLSESQPKSFATSLTNKMKQTSTRSSSVTKTKAHTKRGLAKRDFTLLQTDLKSSPPSPTRDEVATDVKHFLSTVAETRDVSHVKDESDTNKDSYVKEVCLFPSHKLSSCIRTSKLEPRLEKTAPNIIKSDEDVNGSFDKNFRNSKLLTAKPVENSNDFCDKNFRNLKLTEHTILPVSLLSDASQLASSSQITKQETDDLSQPLCNVRITAQEDSKKNRSLFESISKLFVDCGSKSLDSPSWEEPVECIQKDEVGGDSGFLLHSKESLPTVSDNNKTKGDKRHNNIFNNMNFGDLSSTESTSSGDYFDLPTPPSVNVTYEDDGEDSKDSDATNRISGIHLEKKTENESVESLGGSASRVLQLLSEWSEINVTDRKNKVISSELADTSCLYCGWNQSYPVNSCADSYTNKPTLLPLYGQWMESAREMGFYNAAITHAQPTSSRTPSSLLLSELVKLALYSDNDVSHQAITYLFSWLSLHPPVTSVTIKVYTEAYDLLSEHSILLNFIRNFSEEPKKTLTVYLLEYFVSLFEVNFDFCLKSKDPKLIQNSLIAKWLRRRSYNISYCGTLHILLKLFKDILSASELDTKACTAVCALLNMACECLRLANVQWDLQNPTFVIDSLISCSHDLAKHINNFCPPSSDNARMAVLNMFKTDWLRTLIVSKLLSFYSSYFLLEPIHFNQISLSTIVEQYFFLMPLLEDSQVLDSESRKGTLDSNFNVEDRGDYFNCFKGNSHRAVLTAQKVNKKNHNGESAIHLACKKNKPEELERLLAVPGADVNLRDNNGWTPLHEACNHGSYACVELLLKYVPNVGNVFGNVEKLHKVEIDAVGFEGVTPLHDAVTGNYINVCQLLLLHGGQKLLRSKTVKNQTALDLAKSDEMRNVLKNFLESTSNLDQSICQDSEHPVNIDTVREIAPHTQKYKEFRETSQLPSRSSWEEFLMLLMILVSSYYNILESLERTCRSDVCLHPTDQHVLVDMHKYFSLLKRHVRKLTKPENFENLQFHLQLFETLCIDGPAKGRIQ